MAVLLPDTIPIDSLTISVWSDRFPLSWLDITLPRGCVEGTKHWLCELLCISEILQNPRSCIMSQGITFHFLSLDACPVCPRLMPGLSLEGEELGSLGWEQNVPVFMFRQDIILRPRNCWLCYCEVILTGFQKILNVFNSYWPVALGFVALCFVQGFCLFLCWLVVFFFFVSHSL